MVCDRNGYGWVYVIENSIHWIVFCIILPCGFDKSNTFDDEVVPLVNVYHFNADLSGGFPCWSWISGNQIDILLFLFCCHGCIEDA